MGTDNSQTISQRKKVEAMTEEQLQAATMKVKDYLLSDLKYMRKFKKDEIVLTALNKSSKQYAEIMKRVKNIFSSVFGLNLVKLPNKDDEFIIVNKNPSKYIELTQRIKISNKQKQENLVLQVALASILMDHGSMYESHLLTIYEIVGFMKDSFYGRNERKSPDFIPKLISQFVKQMYLKVEKVDRPTHYVDPPLPAGTGKVTKYAWGYRAFLEIDIAKVVQYVIEIYDGRKPNFFPAVFVCEQKELQDRLRAKLQE